MRVRAGPAVENPAGGSGERSLREWAEYGRGLRLGSASYSKGGGRSDHVGMKPEHLGGVNKYFLLPR